MVLLGNGDGTFASPVYCYDDAAYPLVTADFNGDGKLDLAGGAYVGQDDTAKTAILYGNGDGTFQPAVFPSSLNNFAAGLTADFRSNGKADLLGSGLSGSQVALGNDDGTFNVLPPLSCTPGARCGAYAVADFNGDGKPDLLATQQISSQSYGPGIMLGNGDGTFGPFIGLPFFSFAWVADMNGDGRPDLVLPFGNGVGVLLNTTQPTPDFAIGAASGSPTSQTVSAGQSAKFNLTVTPSGSFTGTVDLSCGISPAVTPAPTCSVAFLGAALRNQLSIDSCNPRHDSQHDHGVNLPRHSSFGLDANGMDWHSFSVHLFWLRNRKRLTDLAAPVIALAMASWAGCGGTSSSSSSTTMQGTLSGTYTATITATSGKLRHNMTLTVIVH